MTATHPVRLRGVRLFAGGQRGDNWVESGWSAFEFADRVSGREARPSDTATLRRYVRLSGRNSVSPTTKA